MKRIVVVGGLGQFGRTIAEQLRRMQLPVCTASRNRAADIQLDANDATSIRTSVKGDDIVIDAAGPFSTRATSLVEAAMEVGFDLIDISDDLRYAEAVLNLQSQIETAGIRVLSSASTVTAVAAAVLRHSEMPTPRRVTAILIPASRRSSNVGAALSLIHSLGREVRVFRDGRLKPRVGWGESFRFQMPAPLGIVEGRLFESADAVYLPLIWPTLCNVSMYVDTNVPGVNSLLHFAAQRHGIRKLLERGIGTCTTIARALGRTAGGLGYEIEDSDGHIARYAITSEHNSLVTAVAPPVLAARAIAEDRFPWRGLVLPDRHVEPLELFEFLQTQRIAIHRMESD